MSPSLFCDTSIRYNAVPTIDLDHLVLTNTSNAHHLIPRDAKYLDPISTNPLTLALRTLSLNRIYALSHNTFLICFCRPHVPDPTRAVVASGDQTVRAVGVSSQRNNSVRVSS